MSDRIVSRPATAAYRDAWDRVFGKPKDTRERFTFGGVECVVDDRVPNPPGIEFVSRDLVDVLYPPMKPEITALFTTADTDVSQRNYRANFDAAFNPAPPAQSLKKVEPPREDGYYWVKRADIGWTVGKWYSDYGDGGWDVLGLIDAPWTDADLDAIGPRIEPPEGGK